MNRRFLRTYRSHSFLFQSWKQLSRFQRSLLYMVSVILLVATVFFYLNPDRRGENPFHRRAAAEDGERPLGITRGRNKDKVSKGGKIFISFCT